jgi:MYXO-CTERM domain-containing protein
MNRNLILSLVAAISTLALASTASAQINTYDLSTIAGDYTGQNPTVGIATFSSLYDSYNQQPNVAGVTGPTGEFVVGPQTGLYDFSNNSNDYLSSGGYVSAAVSSGFTVVTGNNAVYTADPSVSGPYYAPAVLDINFSKAQSALSFNWGTLDSNAFGPADGGDYVKVTTNTGASQIFNFSGFSSLYGAGIGSAEGSVDFTSASPFTSVSIQAYDSVGDQDLTIGDFTSINAAPEPSSWTLGVIALGGLLVVRRRALRA